MSKQCVVTKKDSMMGGGYSNRTRATEFNPTGSRRRYANVHKKRIFVPEVAKTFIVNISAKGLKTLNKNGAYKTLKKAGVIKD